MSRAEAAREKAARLSRMRHAPVIDPERLDHEPAAGSRREPEPASETRPRQPQRVRPVKVSLELAPELHAELTRWCLDAARQLGRGRVNSTEPLRALLRRLLDDEQLSAEVVAELRREGRR